MLRYITNIFCIALASFSMFAQNDSLVGQQVQGNVLIVEEPKSDSLKIKETYGLRLGVDVSKFIRPFVEDDYTGFEVMGDYRLTRKWYLAGEIGAEDKRTQDNDYLDVTTQGTYFKAGADWNAYENWYGMENMIYLGFRVGASSFRQTLHSYGVYSTDQYWQPQFTNNEEQEFKGLSAIWGEVIAGLKVEVFNNIYMGVNVQFKYLVTQDEPSGFENLYIPGYQRTYDSSNFGFGFGYNVSYLIPFFKKDKKKVAEEE
ncbi:DUF6048 family protein [Mangrovimonas sp. ST2L15]|uniref:DUF6048 family protein n=1 Tax=Mangrovimonas sp. ST2L15 TaxID=1645916 RepID=UPI0006B593D3|nr:DUF6048 family protein [Mangrovimonas sp. ST2L15]